MRKTLKDNVSFLNYDFKHVAEVGVHYPESSNIKAFIVSGVKSTLVEPDPLCIEKIKQNFSKFNVKVIPKAVTLESGTITMYRTGASTFVSSVNSSPALINDNYKKKDQDSFEVETVTFDMIDDGTIDLISIDIEGSEWFVIKNMVSRPKVISVETHFKCYINPHYSEIENWMCSNGYSLTATNKSDSIYIHDSVNTRKNSIKAILLRFRLMVNLKYQRARRKIKSFLK